MIHTETALLLTPSLLMPKASFQRQLPPCTSKSYHTSLSSYFSPKTSHCPWFLQSLSLWLGTTLSVYWTSFSVNKTVPWPYIQKTDIPPQLRLSQRSEHQASACLGVVIGHIYYNYLFMYLYLLQDIETLEINNCSRSLKHRR